MRRPIRILEQAAEEAIEAAAWYEQERPGLGIEFNHAINAALDLLEQDIVPLANWQLKNSNITNFFLSIKHLYLDINRP